MNKYETLLQEAYDAGLSVKEAILFESNAKALIKGNKIGISKTVKTTAEKTCILAEELGHHYTTTGDILDQTSSGNRKQERQARIHAYNKQIGLLGLVKAYEHGCQSAHDAAEYLDVTEEFFLDAVKSYSSKYGECAAVDNYIVYFAPSLCVLKLL